MLKYVKIPVSFLIKGSDAHNCRASFGLPCKAQKEKATEKNLTSSIFNLVILTHGF